MLINILFMTISNYCVVDFFAITRATFLLFFFFYHHHQENYSSFPPLAASCVFTFETKLCLPILVTSSFVFSLFWSLLYDIFYFGHFFIISFPFPHLAASCVYLQFLRPDLFWSLLFIILVTVL